MWGEGGGVPVDRLCMVLQRVYCACDPIVHVHFPSIGFVFVCRKFSLHVRVREMDHMCFLFSCCFFV